MVRHDPQLPGRLEVTITVNGDSGCIPNTAYEKVHTSLQEYDERMEDLQDPNRILAPNDFMDVADS